MSSGPSLHREGNLLFHSWRCPLALSAVPPWWNHLADMQLRPGKGVSSSQCILTFCWQDMGGPLGEPAWGWSFDLAKHWSCGKESRTFLFWPGQKEVAMDTLLGNNLAVSSVSRTKLGSLMTLNMEFLSQSWEGSPLPLAMRVELRLILLP